MKLSDAFAVLGLPPGEKDPATIRSAYRQQLLQAHPDKGGDVEVFRQVHLAGDLLLSTQPAAKVKPKAQRCPTPKPPPGPGPSRVRRSGKSKSFRLTSVFQESENLDALFSGRNPSKGSRGLTSEILGKVQQAKNLHGDARSEFLKALSSNTRSQVERLLENPANILGDRAGCQGAQGAETADQYEEPSEAHHVEREIAGLKARLAALSQQERRDEIGRLPPSQQQALKKHLLA
ncbi:unnamed protein product, partial [Cladocopium goreaui]